MSRMSSGWRASWRRPASTRWRSPFSTASPTRMPSAQARAAVLRAAPDMRVSISSDVVPEIREFERTSTTIANVYVQSRVERYLRELEQRLQRAGFVGNLFMMLSSGGLATLETATRFPVRLLESGPAAGALAAATFGAAAGHADLLSFDMGGTTAKFCGDRPGPAADRARLRGRPALPLQERLGPADQDAGDRDDRDRRGRRLDRARQCAWAAQGRAGFGRRRPWAGLLRARRQRADRHRRRSGAGLPRPSLLPGRRHGARS